MSLRAAIFDVDGTLVDNHEAHEDAWLEWSRRSGHPIDRGFYREHLYARSNPQILRKLLGDSITDAQILQWAADKEKIYRDLYAPALAPMPGVLALMNAFDAAGVRYGVASNAERVNVDFVVDGLRLRPRLGAVLAVEDVANGKPEPDLFLLAARQLGASPGECVVFEDSMTGFEAARRAGMTCIAITGHSRISQPPPHVKSTHRDFTTLSLATIQSLP